MPCYFCPWRICMRRVAIICFILITALLTGCGSEAKIPGETDTPGPSVKTETPASSPEASEPVPVRPETTPATPGPTSATPEPSVTDTPSVTNEPDQTKISFTDKTLENIIRTILDKPDGDIYAHELESITELYVWGSSTTPEEGYEAVSYPGKERRYNGIGTIYSLEDIVHLKNLKHLTLVKQKIWDFKPVGQLKELESLNISDNGISDFSFLKDLKKLKSLNISYNSLPVLEQVTGLTNLEKLDISYNGISSINGLEKLDKLKVLIIDQGWADDKSRISDLSPLRNMKDLEILSLEANRVADLTPISDKKNLRALNLCQNRLENVEALSGLVNMETLDLTWNPVNDISPLTSMTKLKTLRIDFDGIWNTYLLRQFPELKNVNFDWNKVPYKYSIGKEFAQTGIDPGNHANWSPVGFDGSALYFVYFSYGDLPHPELIRVDIGTGRMQGISGTITAQMSSMSGAAEGGYIDEEVYSLNIYKGKLYYYSIGNNASEAEPVEWGYYPGSDIAGLTRMNPDGSERVYLTTESCSYVNIKNDKIYYLNEDNLPSCMDLDGRNQVVLVSKRCKFLYATDNRLYYIPVEEEGLLAMSFDSRNEETVISGAVSSPIILDDAIYYINGNGNICKYSFGTRSVSIIKQSNAKCLNMNYRYIFYSDGNYLYRMDHNGGNEQVIYEVGLWRLYVVGDYVFFYDGNGLVKIRDDGSEYVEYYEFY